MLKALILVAVMAISAPLGAIVSHICAPYIYAAVTKVVAIEAGTTVASAVYMACGVFTAMAVVGAISYLAYVFYKMYNSEDEVVLKDIALAKMFFRAVSFSIEIFLVLARGSNKTEILQNENTFGYCKSNKDRKHATGSHKPDECKPCKQEVNGSDYNGPVWTAKPE